jgi:hypothetical protein
MRFYLRSASTLLIVTALSTPALAQNDPFGQPQPAPPPGGGGGTWQQPGQQGAPGATAPPAEQVEAKQPKEPKRGDFNAGGQVRLPSGPDEMGEYATFNWVALDMKGKYYLLDSVTAEANIPIAVIHPDSAMIGGGMVEPGYFGGFSATLDAKLPKGPFASMMKYEADVGLLLTGSYMVEGAMLLSEKDFPLFTGNFAPGFSGGLKMNIKMSSLVDFKLNPVWVYQAAEVESLEGVQIPMSLVLALGDVIKVSADLGIFTGDDYSFGADNGGRIYAGGALDVKIGKLIFHGGAGTASLLTGGLYPSVRDAFYLDLNVAFAK